MCIVYVIIVATNNHISTCSIVICCGEYSLEFVWKDTLFNYSVCIIDRFLMYKDMKCGFLCNTCIYEKFQPQQSIIFQPFPTRIIHGEMTLEISKPSILSHLTPPKSHPHSS